MSFGKESFQLSFERREWAGWSDNGRQTVPHACGCNSKCPVAEVNSLETVCSCHREWYGYGLTSHWTHFRSFQRRWGDCGISQDCSHSQRWG